MPIQDYKKKDNKPEIDTKKLSDIDKKTNGGSDPSNVFTDNEYFADMVLDIWKAPLWQWEYTLRTLIATADQVGASKTINAACMCVFFRWLKEWING
jgi:hypothetical protein